jgi:hypothetical protein
MVDRREIWVPFVAAAAVVAAVLGPLAGCSSSAAPEGGSAADPATEAERVHSYLEGRYPSTAVRHSYRTALGQTVDCVDFFSMPAVRAMAARGEPITEMPQAPPPRPRRLRDGRVVIDPPQPEPHSEGIDEDGHERLCPAGTVSQIRIGGEDIARAGGFDAFQRARRKHAPPHVPQGTVGEPAPPTMWPCVDAPGSAPGSGSEFHQYAHILGDVVDHFPGLVYAADTMSVHAPKVPILGDHSVAQVWLFGGTWAQDLPSDGSCPGDCVQTIEIGWAVDSLVPTSTGTSDPVNPHLFIFSTTDGYVSEECWNGETNGHCGFIEMGGIPSQFLPGVLLPHNNPPSAPVEMTALVVQISGDYWVQVGVAGQTYYLGYYPGSNFSQPLSTFQVGGEVYDGNNTFMNTNLQMGSGNPASEGYGEAAYHHDSSAEAWVNGESTNFWGTSSYCATKPPSYPGTYPPYEYATWPAPGASSWDGYFYYGGTPTCTPSSCAAQGLACGAATDLCGGPLSCGTCATGHVCQENECACSSHCAAGYDQDPSTCKCMKGVMLHCGGKGQPLCQ